MTDEPLPQDHQESDGTAVPTTQPRRNTSKSSSPSSPPQRNNGAHSTQWVLQSKGGVGKTLVSWVIAQYLKDCNRQVTCIDTDPYNGTFSEFKSLAVESVELLDKENELDVPVMNACVSRMLSESSDFVIDSGAGSFGIVTDYLVRTSMFDLLAEYGKRVVIHAVMVGGGDLFRTTATVDSMLHIFPPSVELCLWLKSLLWGCSSRRHGA